MYSIGDYVIYDGNAYTVLLIDALGFLTLIGATEILGDVHPDNVDRL